MLLSYWSYQNILHRDTQLLSWKDAMVHEGTRSVAAGRISFIPWEQSALHWKIKITISMLCSWLLPTSLSFLNKLGTHLHYTSNFPTKPRSKHHTGFVLIPGFKSVLLTTCCTTLTLLCSYFTSVICACLKWACQHTVVKILARIQGLLICSTWWVQTEFMGLLQLHVLGSPGRKLSDEGQDT